MRNVILFIVVIIMLVYGYFSFHVLSNISGRDDMVIPDGAQDIKLSELEHSSQRIDGGLLSESSRILKESSSSINGDKTSTENNMNTTLKKGTDPTQFLTVEGIEDYYSKHLSPLNDVVTSWPPEFPDAKPKDYIDVVPTFDWNDPLGRKAAQLVRECEKPFKIMNLKDLEKVKKKWNYSYLKKRLGAKTGNVEVSQSKSFMFWKKRTKEEVFQPVMKECHGHHFWKKLKN